MIELNVKDYCQDCEAFDPDSETTKFYELGVSTSVLTIITCRNARRCEQFVRYLERKMRNDNGES